MSLSSSERAVVSTYDLIAEEWAATHSTPGYWRDHLEHFAARLPPGGKVLEVGSGGGRDGAWFVKNGFAYTGTDVSRGLLEVARANVPGGDFRHATPYGPPGGSYDGVWSIATLIHVPPSRMHEALRGIRGVMKPGGLLAVTMKPGGYPHTGEQAASDGRRWWVWQPGEYAIVMEEAGLKVLDMFTRHGPLDGDRGWACFLAQEPGA